MSDPIVYAYMGYLVGVALGLLAGLDAVVRVCRAGVRVTSRREAARWLLGFPVETEEEM